jgi:predicted membrane-bound spermidine synthase
VLVTGLGLGCVVRGLLAKPEVDHIDVVELDGAIIDVVGAEFAAEPRVTIHHHNALTFPVEGRSWDVAWHDIWCERNDGLDMLHAKMIHHFADACPQQGAWAFPRWAVALYGTAGCSAPRS